MKRECKKCGQCCKRFHLPVSYDEMKEIRRQYKRTGKVMFPNGNRPANKSTETWLAKHVRKNPVYGWRCSLITKDNSHAQILGWKAAQCLPTKDARSGEAILKVGKKTTETF